MYADLINEITGNNVKRMRERAGYSQQALAEAIDAKCKQAISPIETGKRALSSAMLVKLCELFACGPEEFYRADVIDGIDKMLCEEIHKMDKTLKADLYAAAVKLNAEKSREVLVKGHD